jgi:hypothetical protein
LIAVTARDVGATIITMNIADFSLVGHHVDIHVAPPWPRDAAV